MQFHVLEIADLDRRRDERRAVGTERRRDFAELRHVPLTARGQVYTEKRLFGRRIHRLGEIDS